MHQTFYIDLEEEISSVIDRLNKSMSTDNYFVLPKRAIFLQSIVNLKLLKREADKVGKHVIIVTQDEVGASMAQRSGLAVRSSLDGLESVLDIEDEATETEVENITPVIIAKPRIEQKKEMRLNGVGTNDFYDASAGYTENSSYIVPTVKSSATNIPINGVVSRVKKQELPATVKVQNPIQDPSQNRVTSNNNSQVISGLGYGKNLNIEKEKSLEKMYSSRKEESENIANSTGKNDNKVRNIFISFVGLCLLAFIGVAAYLFVPSAKIIIEPNILNDKADFNIIATADTSAVDQSRIPVRVIDKEEKVTLPYDVKGGAAINGKKAHGSVVIYNEFDNSPQTLIATTRLESKDGKIYRIVKNVVVPGSSSVAGEIKPGAITAEVIADQSGTDYNINATTFSIPGFKDSPKYDKFYAKSTEAFVGGSTEGETAGGAISQKDIDNAKQKTESSVKEKITQEINAELSDSEHLLDQAMKITITKSSTNVKAGDMVSSFEYNVVASVHALVFSEKDVISVAGQSFTNNKDVVGKRDVSKIEYGTVNADFEKNLLEFKIYAEITTNPIIDSEQIKKDLLGKREEELPAILMKYPSIRNINVEFKPKIVSRIPQYSQRVTIEVKK